MKINGKYIINNVNIYNKEKETKILTTRLERIVKIKKIAGYFIAIAFPFSFLLFVLKSSGLFKKLHIDEKFTNRKKSIEKSHGVDLELNDQRIETFDKNWGINLANDEIENRKKLGNKIFNEKPAEPSIIKEEEISNKLEESKVEVIKEGQNPLTVESNVFFDSKFK